MRMIFLHSAEGPVKESGSRGRWRQNPGIQFDLSQLSPRLCSSQYVSKVRGSFCVLSRAKMQRSLEQRYVIKVRVKLGKSGSETLQLLRTAYGDAVLSSAQVFRWHMPFEDGKESVEDEQCAGRPSTSRTENNVARVKAVLDRDQHLNVWLITEEVGLPKKDVHRIITEDLHMRKICARLVFFFLCGSTTLYRVLAFSTNSFHFPLSSARVFQFGTFNFCISFLVSSTQRVLGLPIGLLEIGFQE